MDKWERRGHRNYAEHLFSIYDIIEDNNGELDFKKSNLRLESPELLTNHNSKLMGEVDSDIWKFDKHELFPTIRETEIPVDDYRI